MTQNYSISTYPNQEGIILRTINTIKINVNSKKSSIDPWIYGNFIEHIGECIHNGIWAYDPISVPLYKWNELLNGMREDVIQAAKELKPTVLRAFGGCYSDVYHWKDAIGPKSSRKKVKNLQWSRFPFKLIKGLGPNIENQFGTDEFLHFCEVIGAEPYLNVNYSTGTPEEAADWVEYCNGSTDTEYGSLRAKNGREQPYNVKYWGIANEIWGPQEKGYEKHPEEYAKNYLPFARAMRKKDPSIKLIAVGWSKSEWNQAVLKGIGEEWMDFLSMHQYLPFPMGINTLIGKKHPHEEQTYHALMSAYRKIEQQINLAWNDIITVFGEQTRVRISFDEWGIWYKIKDMIHTNFNLQDGLCAALIQMIFQKQSNKTSIALWSMLTNFCGTIQTDPDGIILTPPYLALKMLRDHSYGTLLEDIEVKCASFPSRKYGQIDNPKEELPYISCNATINDDLSKLSVILVNCHYITDLNAEISLQGFKPKENCTKIVLNSESPFDYNTIQERNKIRIIEEKIHNTNNPLSTIVPAHSLIIHKFSRD